MFCDFSFKNDSKTSKRPFKFFDECISVLQTKKFRLVGNMLLQSARFSSADWQDTQNARSIACACFRTYFMYLS